MDNRIMFQNIARKALDAVRTTYADSYSQLMLDYNGDAHAALEMYGEYPIYLYVYSDGSFVIDAPDYLQDHRNITSQVMALDYDSAATLAEELEAHATDS